MGQVEVKPLPMALFAAGCKEKMVLKRCTDPPALRMEDFIDVIRETVPQMIEQVHQGIKRDHTEVSPSDTAPSSPSEPGNSQSPHQ